MIFSSTTRLRRSAFVIVAGVCMWRAPAQATEGNTIATSTSSVVISTPVAMVPMLVPTLSTPTPAVLPVIVSTPMPVPFSTPVSASTTVPLTPSTPVTVPTPAMPTPVPLVPAVPPAPPALLLMVHPTEGMKLPPLSQIFVYGSVAPGSTLFINGSTVTVHSHGGFLLMMPVLPGENTLHADVRDGAGRVASLDRHFLVAPGFQLSTSYPTVIERFSVMPVDDQIVTAGDLVRVFFQGSPQGVADFSILGGPLRVPMNEIGVSTMTRRGQYTGYYVVPPGLHLNKAPVEVTLRKNGHVVTARAIGRVTVDPGTIPVVGLITDDTVAVRTAPEGGYESFLYSGMRVRLTGKVGNQWRVRLSSQQSGWIKDSAVVELPRGTSAPQSVVSNIMITHSDEDTTIRVPLSDSLPFKTEESFDPMQLIVTFYGAFDKTDLIRYDPADPLVKIVRWKQLTPDTVQLFIQPKFKTWWGYDARYEGNTFVIELRPPWTGGLSNMVIAVDPGHGGNDDGATGPHGLHEKDCNLQIARLVRDELAKAGAKPFLTRDADVDVSLYDRPRIAWARHARLFISVHANAPGEGENPIWNNGFSTYWYQPHSLDMASAIHDAYVKHIPLTDHGLFFADLAVCRMTQMPAVLTEQAFIVVPEQEDMLFDPKSQKEFATTIVNGIKAFLAK